MNKQKPGLVAGFLRLWG